MFQPICSQCTIMFSDVFCGQKKGALGTNGLIQRSFGVISKNTIGDSCKLFHDGTIISFSRSSQNPAFYIYAYKYVVNIHTFENKNHNHQVGIFLCTWDLNQQEPVQKISNI